MLRLAALTLAVLALLFLLERALPLRARRAQLATRLLVNGVLAVLAYSLSGVLVSPAVRYLMTGTDPLSAGLLPWLGLPPLAEAGLALALMDLSFYYWHRLNHRLPVLWRFHNVHHLDPDLDVTTALRFHFGEIALSTLFRSLQVGVLGVGLSTYVLYESLLQGANLFHHSNLRLPIALERALNLVFVTPRMHGIHHSEIEGEASSNYSVVFSVWDRLHRSLCLGVPQSAITVGVPGYSQPGDNRLLAALAHPFRAQRDYWRRPDGSRPARPEPPRSSRLAE